jgi:GT2 family glycosyltransferase
MTVAASSRPRVVVDGRFFRLGETKLPVKGVAYGPFAPDAQGLPFAPLEATARDLDQIRELGANLVRVYNPPPRWFLDLAAERGLLVLLDSPWNKHLAFDSESRRADAREAVRRALSAVAGHTALFACSVANEIPPDLVRWAGPKAVADFIDELIAVAREVDPGCLCTFTNFPPTEFLRPQNPDFICFNVYLHEERPFRNYLARLQMLADSKPLVLGEIGVDSRREGEARQSELLAWQIEAAFRGGLAGAVVFRYTDEWFRGGRAVDDWKMGLVTGDRRPKPAFRVVQRQFHAAPHFPLPQHPKVSVVVASYNAARTLPACLESLQRLNYPDYEVILVDDGSTDATPQIAARHPGVRCFRHEKNLGLSVARNTGLAAAAGRIVAFTDADCRADEDWLYYLVGDLVSSGYAGIGGPNLLPPEDSLVAAAVMASPGGPAHVMLTDREAEHIPGCNMAFYKWALEEVGGFDPVFRQAGDDVDLCWRLQQAGHRIGFSPAACVWHYRRSTIAAYLEQQRGYGEAEALLAQKHPEHFNSLGGGIWRGRIYAPSKYGVETHAPVIYHGRFGSAGFQKLYASGPETTLLLCTTLEYHFFVTLPLWILTTMVHDLLALAIAALLLPAGICAAAGAQAVFPGNRTAWWSRPLVTLLFLLQPVVRGWARYQGRLNLRTAPLASRESLDSFALRSGGRLLGEARYWASPRLDRLDFVAAVLRRLDRDDWVWRSDVGWSDYDVEICGSRWSQLQLTTVAEDHPPDSQMICCRLRPRWSLAARVAFWGLLGLGLLVIGLMGAWRPWSWLVLLILPVAAWWLWLDQRKLQSVIAVLLDELAKELKLTRVSSSPREPAPQPKVEMPTGPSPFRKENAGKT